MFKIYVYIALVALCALSSLQTATADQSECPYYVRYQVNDTDLPHECESCNVMESYMGHCRKRCPELYQRISHTTCIPLVGRTYKLEDGSCPEGSQENDHGTCTIPDIVSLEYAISDCKLSIKSPYYYDAPYPDFEFMVLAGECK